MTEMTLAAKLKRRFDNWQDALNDSDQTVRQCQMKRVMFQAELEEAYRSGDLIPRTDAAEAFETAAQIAGVWSPEDGPDIDPKAPDVLTDYEKGWVDGIIHAQKQIRNLKGPTP